MQISKGDERRQYNIMGNLACTRRESFGNSSSDHRSRSRLHKRQSEDISTLSVSIPFYLLRKKPRSCKLPLTSKWRTRESRRTYRDVQEIRDNFRHLLFLMQNHRNFAFTITSGAYGSTDQYVKEMKRQCKTRY